MSNDHSELSPAERSVDAVLELHLGYDMEPDERASLASLIVMALTLAGETAHCGCRWCIGEKMANGECGCEFCNHRRANRDDDDESCRGCAECMDAPPVYGALARAEALAAGREDWMTVTRWPVP